MSDPIQVEPIAAAGSEETELQAAFPDAFPTAEPTAEPVAEPAAEPVAAAPEVDPDFTFTTLENGQREMKLATGQVYRGKDDTELYGQLAKAQIAASRRITELSARPEPIAPVAPVSAAPEAIDPTALAIADLMAPAFGLKSGKELVEAFARQQHTTQTTEEYLASQAANFESQKFFMANPDFPKTAEATGKIDTYMATNNIPFNAQNAEMVYNHLKAKGEMTAAPASVPRATAPKNNMPPPPTGTAPAASTGRGALTDEEMMTMPMADFEAHIFSQLQ